MQLIVRRVKKKGASREVAQEAVSGDLIGQLASVEVRVVEHEKSPKNGEVKQVDGDQEDRQADIKQTYTENLLSVLSLSGSGAGFSQIAKNRD